MTTKLPDGGFRQKRQPASLNIEDGGDQPSAESPDSTDPGNFLAGRGRIENPAVAGAAATITIKLH